MSDTSDDAADRSRRTMIAAALTAGIAVAGIGSVEAQQQAITSLEAAAAPVVVDIAFRAQAISSQIAASVSLVRLLGYYAPGDGGGAVYRRVEKAPEHALWFRSSDGAVWAWSDTRLCVLMAGARGDGKYDSGTSRILGGSDDTQAIQDAISAHCFFGLADACHFPNRTFRTTQPLHAHYGTSYDQCRLFGQWNFRGVNPAQRYRTAPSGTTILCDFTEGMGINIAGNYGAHLRGLALIGRNATWIRENELGYGRPPKLDDTIAANWIDPALPNAASGRYSPLSGITFDAFYHKGQPAYPALVFPPFMPDRKVDKGSTQLTIEKCSVEGFIVGIADAPGGSPYSSDQVQLRHVVFDRCQYGLSAGQSQQRNLMRDSCFYSRCFCAETTNTHGAQQGTLGISINTGYAGVIEMFSLAASGGSSPYFNGMPISFTGCYGETMWRMGDIAADTPVETSLVFDGCSFSFDAFSVPSRGVPATMLAGFKPGMPINISFRNTRLSSYLSVFPVMFDAECVSADGLHLLSNNGIGIAGNNYQGSGYRVHAYQRAASNATADGLILYDGSSRTGRMRLKFAQYNIDALAVNPGTVRNVICGPIQRVERSSGACVYMQRIVGREMPDGEGAWLPRQTRLLEKRSLQDLVLLGKTLSFALPQAARDATTLAYSGPSAGDILLDQISGSVFFVRSLKPETGVVTAELQNNFFSTDQGRSFQRRMEVDLGKGTFLVTNTRLFTPSHDLAGDIEQDTARITNVRGASKQGPLAMLDLSVGDFAYVDPLRENALGRESGRVTGLGSTEFTLAGAASVSQRQRLFQIFIRPGLKNV